MQSEGAANREDPVTHLYSIRISKFRDGQFLVRVNLDYRQVRVLVHANNFGRVACGFSVQLHLDLRGLLDDVVVRQNVSALVHDHAGTQAAFRLRRSILAAVEESVEEILHRVILIIWLRAALLGLLALQHLRRGDVYNRGFHAIHDPGERIGSGNRVRHRKRRRCRTGESKALRRRHAAGNDRANKNSNYQRERDKYRGEYFPAPRPIHEFLHLLSHITNPFILAPEALFRQRPYSACCQSITLSIPVGCSRIALRWSNHCPIGRGTLRFLFSIVLDAGTQKIVVKSG